MSGEERTTTAILAAGPAAARALLPLTVLVIDDERNIRRTLALCLESDGHDVSSVGSAAEAIEEAARHFFDLAFVDLRLGSTSGLELIGPLLATNSAMKIVMITAYAAIDTAVEAMRRGAADYLSKPFTPAQVLAVTRRVSELRQLERRIAALEAGADRAAVTFDSACAAMQRAVGLAHQVAATDATVLLRGETGTGKGVLARAIHAWSDRAQHPFAVVSCPSLPMELLESELFGHARGAFTGAVRDNPGRIAAVERGTLLLDEIADLALPLQAKLLRFLQDRQYERLGEQRARTADVRVLAASNVDLELAAREGRFRQDLYYRINVIQIDLPPLRERLPDLIPLAEALLAEVRRRRSPIGFTDEAIDVLKRYSWPGNVRELRNVIERAAILCGAERIGREHLPPGLAPQPPVIQVGDRVSLAQLEQAHIRRVLAGTHSLEEAAAILGIDAATLWRKRRKLGI
ncbi:MAG: sigma-54-dependent Fis family transcriptional regulator [Candidatus Schekmanbacteria bacterium]|nr:sigma-54-dependent Fis family transcriptional regulator [Candidatus Schekmanbacteria bacterium]